MGSMPPLIISATLVTMPFSLWLTILWCKRFVRNHYIHRVFVSRRGIRATGSPFNLTFVSDQILGASVKKLLIRVHTRQK